MTPSANALVDRLLLDELTKAVAQASAAILSIHGSDLKLRSKPDRSPVTAADEASQDIVCEALVRLFPGVPVVSEEAAARPSPSALGGRFFLVDPLDGTREFIAGDNEYTVNVALIDGGRPVAGIVAAPAMGVLWRGVDGQGAERISLQTGAVAGERTAIRTRKRPQSGMVAMTSRSHPDAGTGAYLDRIAGVQRMVCGSSLKFCRIAEGVADVYPRLVSLSEWDVAAGHALVTAAGGAVTTIEGQPLAYGNPGFRLAPFVAWGNVPA